MAVKGISEDRSSQNCLQNIINVIKSELFTTGVICTCAVYIVHVHVFGISITLYVEVVSQLRISEKLLYGHQEKSLTLAQRSTKQEPFSMLHRQGMNLPLALVQKGESSGKAVAALRYYGPFLYPPATTMYVCQAAAKALDLQLEL